MREPMSGMSVLVRTFGESPLVKVIDFFLTFRAFDYSKSQVASETEVSRITIEKIFKRLVANKIIIKTREVGMAQLYKLNLQNSNVKALIEMDMKISSAAARENLKRAVSV